MSNSSAVDGRLLARVRNRLVGGGAPVTPAAVAAAVRAESDGLAADADVLATLRAVQQEFSGAGVLEPLLEDPEVCDVLVTAPDRVWVDRGDGLRRAAVRLPDEDSVRRLAQRLAMSTGRRLDDAQPWVDAWLPQSGASGAVRLHAVLPPVAGDGTCISLRVLRPAAHDLSALRESGVFDDELGAVLRDIVATRLAFLVVGGTASGKTTLLAAMLGEVADAERVVCVEEAAELRPRHPHVVRLLTRPANVEGAGEIGVRDLVRQALRMRPDRLVVGEVRGGEVRELLAAMNTGHDGGCGTLHANSPREVPARMEALAALAGLSREALHGQLAAAVQVVLHVRRTASGRHLAGIGVLRRDDERVRVVPAWQRDTGWTEGRADLAELLTARGGESTC
ncbi:TadA family conjugal transfer-associated ATPase [Saccharopolyspora halophila]|uniref:TadA family conjugal transfer-associated ATPase n=1 Tax=Saccharopolyspora halophila TaxID=405551 RepID=A0ABN3FSM6_9PSEU